MVLCDFGLARQLEEKEEEGYYRVAGESEEQEQRIVSCRVVSHRMSVRVSYSCHVMSCFA